MINKPAILFSDEPIGAMNKANFQEVLNLLSLLYSDGQSILLVTYDKEAALRGSHILYLDDGRIIGELELQDYAGKDKRRKEKLYQ